MKEILLKFALRIGFIKRWYVGNEMLKNPPTVVLADGSVLDGATITNTCISVKGGVVKNNTHITTFRRDLVK